MLTPSRSWQEPGAVGGFCLSSLTSHSRTLLSPQRGVVWPPLPESSRTNLRKLHNLCSRPVRHLGEVQSDYGSAMLTTVAVVTYLTLTGTSFGPGVAVPLQQPEITVGKLLRLLFFSRAHESVGTKQCLPQPLVSGNSPHNEIRCQLPEGTIPTPLLEKPRTALQVPALVYWCRSLSEARTAISRCLDSGRDSGSLTFCGRFFRTVSQLLRAGTPRKATQSEPTFWL